MRRPSVLAALVVVALVVLVPVSAQGANGHANYHAVCPGPPAGYGHCHALVVTDSRGNPRAKSAPYGLSPATIKSVYGFPTSLTAGTGKTIAIVDAYDDPTAESDLNTFSTQYGLPPCTTGNGCFKKVNQSGGTSYPSVDSGWALEISLDVQWAHAIAPGATILLVEASSNSFSDLLTAENWAKTHAQYVSNSWGGGESRFESSYDSYFSQPGVSFFVSAGDSGTPAEYPSASPNVISVGGTTLNLDSGGNLVSETGWSGGGGGCSRFETATSAQSSFSEYGQVGCNGKRATPDVSLDADPASGVSVYDSTVYSGQSGWWKVGGTSASSPMWAGRAAVAGAVVNSGYVYGSSIPFRDITSGNNGAPCLVGFDLCSGRGSWNDGGSQSTPDFALSVSPSSQTVTAGAGTSYTVSVSPTGGFSSSVDLAVDGCPSGATCTLETSSLVSGSTLLDISTTSGTATGPFTLTVSGTGGGKTHTAQVSLTVNAPQQADFSLSVSPGNRTVKRGQTASFSIAITPSGGFNGSVGLSLAGLPSGTSYLFAPQSTSSSSTLTVTTTGSTPRGSYTLTITGDDGGGLTHSATVTLKVH
jgi:subtilase family serine protease